MPTASRPRVASSGSTRPARTTWSRSCGWKDRHPGRWRRLSARFHGAVQRQVRPGERQRHGPAPADIALNKRLGAALQYAQDQQRDHPVTRSTWAPTRRGQRRLAEGTLPSHQSRGAARTARAARRATGPWTGPGHWRPTRSVRCALAAARVVGKRSRAAAERAPRRQDWGRRPIGYATGGTGYF